MGQVFEDLRSFLLMVRVHMDTEKEGEVASRCLLYHESRAARSQVRERCTRAHVGGTEWKILLPL